MSRNDLDWSYVAGFFDGEGSLRFRKTMVELNFANTNLEVLERLKVFLKAGKVYNHFTRASQCFLLSVCNHEDVLRIAKAMLPHSIVKARKLRELVASIEGKVWSPHWRKGVLNGVTKEHLRELYQQQGKSLSAIGRQFGVGPYAVAYRLRKFDIPVRPRGHKSTLNQFRQKNPGPVGS